MVLRPEESLGGAGWSQLQNAIVYDPELFRREILSRLRSVPLGEIMATTGCSKASPSDYRRGKRTSHVSTGMALARLVDVSS